MLVSVALSGPQSRVSRYQFVSQEAEWIQCCSLKEEHPAGFNVAGAEQPYLAFTFLCPALPCLAWPCPALLAWIYRIVFSA